MKPRSQTVGKFVVLACGMKAAWVLMPVVLLGDPLTKATGVRVPDADRDPVGMCLLQCIQLELTSCLHYCQMSIVDSCPLLTGVPNRQLSIIARCLLQCAPIHMAIVPDVHDIILPDVHCPG